MARRTSISPYGKEFLSIQSGVNAFAAGRRSVMDRANVLEEKISKDKQRIQKEKRAQRDALDAVAMNAIGNIGKNYVPEKVPDIMRPGLQDLLVSTKQNAGQMAIMLDQVKKQFGVGSPEYAELQTKLSQQKNIFNAANNVATNYQELTQDYINQRNLVSKAVPAEFQAKLDYVLNPNMRDFQMDWSNATDPTYITPAGPIRHSELDDVYLKDSTLSNMVLNDAVNIEKEAAKGKPLSPTQKNLYLSNIKNHLIKNGKESIESVLNDELFEGFRLGQSITPEAIEQYEAGNSDPIINEIANDIVGHYGNVADMGLKTYEEKSGGPAGSTGPKPTYAQQLASTENKANKTRIDNAYKAAIDAYNQGDLKPGAFERVKTLFGSQVDIAPIDIKRGIFAVKYKSAPTDPDFVSATIDLGDEKSLATLYDLAGIRAGVDYTELPNFQITKPTGPTVLTQEESRTTQNPLLQQ